jgi:hypothetical protein
MLEPALIGLQGVATFSLPLQMVKPSLVEIGWCGSAHWGAQIIMLRQFGRLASGLRANSSGLTAFDATESNLSLLIIVHYIHDSTLAAKRLS